MMFVENISKVKYFFRSLYVFWISILIKVHSINLKSFKAEINNLNTYSISIYDAPSFFVGKTKEQFSNLSFIKFKWKCNLEIYIDQYFNWASKNDSLRGVK
jgi:hypothetical protein